MNMRRLRRMLGMILPEGIKKHLRARLFGYRSAPVGKDWSLDTLPDGNILLRANGIEAKFPESARGSLQYHCFDNGDSVEELHCFMQHAKQGGMLLDVGAADGLFSTLYCCAAKDNRAVAFEPSLSMYQHLLSILALNGLTAQVATVNAAVGQSTGKLSGVLNAAGMLLANSQETPTMEIPMVTLDDQLESVGKPTVVKIDVEGYEGQVIRGARKLLAAHKPVLFLEFHLDILEQQGASASEILTDLVELGYRFETNMGLPLTLTEISQSAKAIIRFVAKAS